MKMTIRLKGFGAALLALSLSSNAWAIEGITQTFAATCTPLKPKNGDGPANTYLSQTLLQPVDSAGDVGDISGNQLSDSNANWEEGRYQAGSHYVHFDNGTVADIDDNTEDTLILAGDLTGRVSPGDRYQIRPHATLGDILGDENGLVAANNPSDADQVFLFNPNTQTTTLYWYSTIPGFEGLRDVLLNPASDQKVYPEEGLIVQRTGEEELCLPQVGSVLDGPMQVPLGSDYSFVGTLQPFEPLDLGDLGLYNGDPDQGFAGAFNPSDGDNLIITDDDGISNLYWYSEIQGYQGWRDILMRDASGVAIAPGQAVFIKRNSENGFFWTIPAP